MLSKIWKSVGKQIPYKIIERRWRYCELKCDPFESSEVSWKAQYDIYVACQDAYGKANRTKWILNNKSA